MGFYSTKLIHFFGTNLHNVMNSLFDCAGNGENLKLLDVTLYVKYSVEQEDGNRIATQTSETSGQGKSNVLGADVLNSAMYIILSN